MLSYFNSGEPGNKSRLIETIFFSGTPDDLRGLGWTEEEIKLERRIRQRPRRKLIKVEDKFYSYWVCRRISPINGLHCGTVKRTLRGIYSHISVAHLKPQWKVGPL